MDLLKSSTRRTGPPLHNSYIPPSSYPRPCWSCWSTGWSSCRPGITRENLKWSSFAPEWRPKIVLLIPGEGILVMDHVSFFKHIIGSRAFCLSHSCKAVKPIAGKRNADDANMLYENKLLGVPRLRLDFCAQTEVEFLLTMNWNGFLHRMLRVRNDSCEIHEKFHGAIQVLVQNPCWFLNFWIWSWA